jgi:thiamine pyrophosphate-dependent acetolactate synthase large subunit-like protein
MIANAAARFTNEPQVCFVTLGPGLTHIMTALASASLDRYPVIFIGAQIESAAIDYNNAHQCIDAVSVAAPLTKFAHEVKSFDEIGSVLNKALTLCRAHPFGPCFISIPIDILDSEVADDAFDSLLTSDLSSPRVLEMRQTDASDRLRDVAKLLEECQQPLIVAGDTILKTDGGARALRDFAESTNIPVITTYSAKGVLGRDHPLNFGTINSYANVLLEFPAVKQQFDEPDCLLLIGYDLFEHYPKAWTEGKPKRIVCLTPFFNAPVKAVRPEISVVCPIVEALSTLRTDAAKFAKPSTYDVTPLRERMVEMMRDVTDYAEGVLPNQVLSILDEHYANDFILANDVGMHRHVSALYYQPANVGDFVSSTGLSSFGTGLPLGIGAKLSNPDRPVVVIAGDGGFHSNSGELETVVRWNLKMVVVVLNNGANGLIKRYQLTGKSRRLNTKATDFMPVDFVKLAEANGWLGVRARNRAALSDALIKADNHAGPTLIEVPVFYPDLYVNPYAKSWKHIDD